MDIWEKPKKESPEEKIGWRLDHPHFQDVYQTTYAKGVITDWKKTSDDPLRVEPMVKVEIEGYGESEDYIPLFFRPKDQYWDTEDYDASDFDQENKYFKASWMSFRCGDEVVVVFNTDTLDGSLQIKHVIGFIDNYPRPGEDIIKYEYETESTTIQCTKEGEAYSGGEAGPDEWPLKLEIEDFYEELTGTPESFYGEDFWWPAPYAWAVLVDELTPFREASHGGPDSVRCECFTAVNYGTEARDADTPILCRHIVIIGPILYYVEHLNIQEGFELRIFFSHVSSCDYFDVPYDEWPTTYYKKSFTYDWECTCCQMFPTLYPADRYGSARHLEFEVIDDNFNVSQNLEDLAVCAGIYTPELYDKLVSLKRNPNEVFTKWWNFEDWWYEDDDLIYQDNFGYQLWDRLTEMGRADGMPAINVSLKRHPHTKDELIAAGYLDDEGMVPED